MMLMTRRVVMYVLLAIAVAAAWPALGRAQSSAGPQSVGRVDALGPKVGERVPEFSGVDQFGHERSLQSILGPQGAMIVFYRSADW
jgi:hypothetical protein